MSRPVTCCLCLTQVDDADTVEMPNGRMCLDPCYLWVERMIEEEEGDEDDEDEDEFELWFMEAL